MPRQGPVKLTKRAVDTLSVESGDTAVWDRHLPGFPHTRLRLRAQGLMRAAARSRDRAETLRPGPLRRYGPNEARRKAAAMIDRIKRGLDPNPPQPAPESTVA